MAAHRESTVDPFADLRSASAGYDTDLLHAQPRGLSAAGSAAAGAGTATSAAGTNPRSAPLLSRTSAGRSTSGKSAVTPWYLKWSGIVALVIALLLALGLGVGLGVGLGTRGDGKGGKANAAPGNAAATVTSLSTLSSIVTGDPTSTTYVPVLVTTTGAGSMATVVQTVGGSTVTVAAPATAPSRAVVTVSEAVAPSTRTEVVQVTTYASTQTITTTLPGGAARTVTQVVTIQRTVTAQATGFARRAVTFGRDEEA